MLLIKRPWGCDCSQPEIRHRDKVEEDVGLGSFSCIYPAISFPLGPGVDFAELWSMGFESLFLAICVSPFSPICHY